MYYVPNPISIYSDTLYELSWSFRANLHKKCEYNPAQDVGNRSVPRDQIPIGRPKLTNNRYNWSVTCMCRQVLGPCGFWLLINTSGLWLTDILQLILFEGNPEFLVEFKCWLSNWRILQDWIYTCRQINHNPLNNCVTPSLKATERLVD